MTSSLTLKHIFNLDNIFKQTNKKLVENGIFFISELHPFKQYARSKAKFETEKGIEELEVFTHHILEYTDAAQKNRFELVELREWFDNESKKKLPILVSFVFKKR